MSIGRRMHTVVQNIALVVKCTQADFHHLESANYVRNPRNMHMVCVFTRCSTSTKCPCRTCFITKCFCTPLAFLNDVEGLPGTYRPYISALRPTKSFRATDPVSLLNLPRTRRFVWEYCRWSAAKLLVSNKSTFSPTSAYRSSVSISLHKESVFVNSREHRSR